MSRGVRRLLILAASLAALALVLALSAILILRSDWFRGKVRDRIVAEVEAATGGRAQIGGFRFDWRRLRAEVDGFALHGNEPVGGPPLARADAIVVGIKVISVLKRSVDLEFLDVRHPQVYVILYPDGHTNVPAPKMRRAGKGTIETILDLAIGRLTLQNGSFEVAGRGKTPFDAEGRNLRAQFAYDAAGPRYSGQVSLARAQFHWGGYRPVPLDVSLALALEKNRVRIDSGRVSTGQSQAEFSGAIESLTDFSGAFQYKVRVSLAEVTRTLGLRTVLEGPVTLAGKAIFHGTTDYRASGSLHAAGVLFGPDPHFILRDFQAEGGFSIDPRRIAVSGLRIGGLALASLTGNRTLEPFPLSGRMETVVLRHKTVEAAGIHIDTLDGFFEGKTQIADLGRVRVEGDVAGFDVRKMMRVYNGQSVPWDGAASGAMQLSVTLGDTSTLQIAGRMGISPAGTGAPVRGAIEATYDAASETLDLGTSWLALPSTRLDFSGVLGRNLRVHADSRNLDEVLPAFDIQSLPVKLEVGRSGVQWLDHRQARRTADYGTRQCYERGLVRARNFEALSGDIDWTARFGGA